MENSKSLISAIAKLGKILSRKEKWNCIGMIMLSPITWLLEIINATVVIILSASLSNPENGINYIQKLEGKLGTSINIDPARMILVLALICGGSYLLKSCFGVLESFTQNFMVQRANYRFKKKLLKRYLSMDYETYTSRNSSHGVTIINHDCDVIFTQGLLSLAIIMSEGFVFCCLLSIIIYMNPSLALSIFSILGFLFFVMYKLVLPFFYNWGRKLQFYGAKTTEKIYVALQAYKEIMLFGKSAYFIDQYNNYSLEKTRVYTIYNSVQNIPRFIIETIFVNLFVFAVIYLSIHYQHPERMLGVLGGYLYFGFRVMPGLNRMVGQINIFKSTIPFINKIYQEFHQDLSKSKLTNQKNFTFNKYIQFNHVSFCFKQSNKAVLEDISLEIRKGECVGITGKTGAGKSTLVDLILGLLSPSKGRILVDDTYSVETYQWHQKIGYVPQSLYLLDDTIKANIAFGVPIDDIDDTRVEYVLEKAQLVSLICKLDNGLDTLIGERGMRLSGGELQRIAIARALYFNPEVIIFDEATSALDVETEEKLMESIYQLASQYTVIMIAHRLSTLTNCDKIYHIEDGRVNTVRMSDANKISAGNEMISSLTDM